jgi:hypothetical protein
MGGAMRGRYWSASARCAGWIAACSASWATLCATESMRATCSVDSWSCRIAAASKRWHAPSSASVGRGGLRASLARDHLLVRLATSTPSMGHALLGAGVRGFDEEVGCQRGLKRRPPLPGDEHVGRTATRKVGSPAFPHMQGVVT